MSQGKIVLWVNTHRKPDSREPHYRGIITQEDGEEQDVSLWINTEIGGTPINLSGQVVDDA